MDREMSYLRKEEATRMEVKRDVFGHLLGKRFPGGFPRVYMEDAAGDFECFRQDAPASAREIDPAAGQVATRAYLDTLKGTWVFIEEPETGNIQAPRQY